MIYSNSIGQKLKNFRQRSGMSQLQLEIEIGASAGSLSRIEKGEVNPSKETLEKISDVLSLSERERDYVYGPLAKPASPEQINLAVNEVKEYFSKKGVLAYMVDERSRMVAVSKDFIKLLEYDDDLVRKGLGRSLISIFLNEDYKLKQLIPEKHYEEVLYNLLSRYYAESGFMQDDEYYQEAIDAIESSDLARGLWQKINNEPIIVHTWPKRKVWFKLHGLDIELVYSDEPLPKFRRFEVVEYVPTNALLKLLTRL